LREARLMLPGGTLPRQHDSTNRDERGEAVRDQVPDRGPPRAGSLACLRGSAAPAADQQRSVTYQREAGQQGSPGGTVQWNSGSVER
jgi:hypothetical protein